MKATELLHRRITYSEISFAQTKPLLTVLRSTMSPVTISTIASKVSAAMTASASSNLP